jgi:hypothetical protein
MLRTRQRGSIVGRSQGLFTPSLNNLSLWLDAADAATIVSSGGQVSQWNDKSGLGNNVTQGVGANQPITGTRTINSRNTIDFNGTTHSMAGPSGLYSVSNGNNCIILVFAADLAGGATQRIYSAQETTGRHYIGINATGVTGTCQAAGAGPATETWAKDANAHMSFLARSGTAQNVNIDGGLGAANSSATSFTSTVVTIGAQTSASNFYDGRIAELLVYSRRPSDGEINRIAQYLCAKWNLPWFSL